MTQSPQGRSDIYQILVFVIILAVILGILVVGGSGNGSQVTPTSAATAAFTVEATIVPTTAATSEATSAATSEATTSVTAEATTLVTSAVTAAATSEATMAATMEMTSGSTSEATGEATAEATVEGTPSVRFVSPVDGATVPATFDVVMAATGLTVEPAGAVHPNAGHFHILIDSPFIEAGQVIPKDATHLHFGMGQTTTKLTLTPGKHVLRLQFADGAHTALAGDQYRDEITVTVSGS